MGCSRIKKKLGFSTKLGICFGCGKLANANQRAIYDDLVLDSQGQKAEKYFFVDDTVGTGNTYLMNEIVEKLASQGYKVIPCASSGIAALLLKCGTQR